MKLEVTLFFKDSEPRTYECTDVSVNEGFVVVTRADGALHCYHGRELVEFVVEQIDDESA